MHFALRAWRPCPAAALPGSINGEKQAAKGRKALQVKCGGARGSIGNSSAAPSGPSAMRGVSGKERNDG